MLCRLVRFNETTQRCGSVQHMCSHAPRCHFAVALRDRLHDAIVLIPGFSHPIALPKLRAPKGVQPRAHRHRLIGKKAVVGSAIDRLMEFAVESIIRVKITFLDNLVEIMSCSPIRWLRSSGVIR